MPDERVYSRHLENILTHRETIVDLATGLLNELEEAVTVLSSLSYPFSLSDYQLDPQQVLVCAQYVRFLRNRYSTFDLAHEVGADAQMFDVLERVVSHRS